MPMTMAVSQSPTLREAAAMAIATREELCDKCGVLRCQSLAALTESVG